MILCKFTMPGDVTHSREYTLPELPRVGDQFSFDDVNWKRYSVKTVWWIVPKEGLPYVHIQF